MGVNINFSQHFHTDAEDVGLGCAVYSIRPDSTGQTGAVGKQQEQRQTGVDESATNDFESPSRDGDNANFWRGGELVMPQISAYLSPEDGDFLAWRTNHLLHGVAPFPPSVGDSADGTLPRPPLRTAFVFFQTEAVHRGCLVCSD